MDEEIKKFKILWEELAYDALKKEFAKAEFSMDLSKGWNLISSPVNFTNLTETFEPIQNDFDSMFAYDGEYQKFIEIDPFSNEEIDLTNGIWIKVL